MNNADMPAFDAMETSVAPSLFARIDQGSGWIKVTTCPNCKRTGAYVDQHTADPCPNCGTKVLERTGRWVDCRRWYDLFSQRGYWEVQAKG